jgi:hypothetical protein
MEDVGIAHARLLGLNEELTKYRWQMSPKNGKDHCFRIELIKIENKPYKSKFLIYAEKNEKPDDTLEKVPEAKKRRI